MSLESALSFFVAVFVFSITPGPGVFAILARALSHGPKACVWLALGMTLSDILYLVAACFGLAVIATNWHGLFLAVRLVGACYLFYLAWSIWTAQTIENNEANVAEGAQFWSGLLQGFAISLSNPKVILFYIAFLPSFMDLTLLDHGDIALAAGLALLSLMLGLMSVAWFAGNARRLFSSARGVRRLNRGASSLLISAGLFLLLKS